MPNPSHRPIGFSGQNQGPGLFRLGSAKWAHLSQCPPCLHRTQVSRCWGPETPDNETGVSRHQGRGSPLSSSLCSDPCSGKGCPALSKVGGELSSSVGIRVRARHLLQYLGEIT